MASDGRPEKSLFTRIKDCILTELKREREQVQRSPCPSRPAWGWTINRGNSDDDSGGRKKEVKSGVEGLKKGQSSSDKSGTFEAEKNCHKKDNTESQRSSDTSDKKEEARSDKHDSAAEPNLSKPNKFVPRYYIKMQDPEAPPCCATVITRRVCSPKTRKPRTFDENGDEYRKPACGCSRCRLAGEQ